MPIKCCDLLLGFEIDWKHSMTAALFFSLALAQLLWCLGQRSHADFGCVLAGSDCSSFLAKYWRALSLSWSNRANYGLAVNSWNHDCGWHHNWLCGTGVSTTLFRDRFRKCSGWIFMSGYLHIPFRHSVLAQYSRARAIRSRGNKKKKGFNIARKQRFSSKIYTNDTLLMATANT